MVKNLYCKADSKIDLHIAHTHVVPNTKCSVIPSCLKVPYLDVTLFVFVEGDVYYYPGESVCMFVGFSMFIVYFLALK